MYKQETRSFNSLDEAMLVIDGQKQGIPFEAIKYLRHQPTSEKLTPKIIFALDHAYDDTYYDEEEDFYYPTPLWYAIVAEKHISKELIAPVISLFTATCDDWDFLSEQGSYLIGELASQYSDLVMEKVMAAVDKLLEEESDLPYLYLFDTFYHVNVDEYKDWFLTTLKDEKLYWKDSFASHLADLQLKEAIPVLKVFIEQNKNNEEWLTREFRFALEELETGVIKYPELAKSYYEKRGDWEEHYAKLENRFYEDEDEIPAVKPEPIRAEKIGRNQPCPCGSGKKYKKCCLGKDT